MEWLLPEAGERGKWGSISQRAQRFSNTRQVELEVYHAAYCLALTRLYHTLKKFPKNMLSVPINNNDDDTNTGGRRKLLEGMELVMA